MIVRETMWMLVREPIIDGAPLLLVERRIQRIERGRESRDGALRNFRYLHGGSDHTRCIASVVRTDRLHLTSPVGEAFDHRTERSGLLVVELELLAHPVVQVLGVCLHVRLVEASAETTTAEAVVELAIRLHRGEGGCDAKRNDDGGNDSKPGFHGVSSMRYSRSSMRRRPSDTMSGRCRLVTPCNEAPRRNSPLRFASPRAFTIGRRNAKPMRAGGETDSMREPMQRLLIVDDD